MLRDYELMYILRPDLDDEALAGATGAVERILAGQEGTVVTTTQWGKRRLAYEIEKLRDGHYVLLHVQLDPGRVREVERLLQINDSVLRHMVTVRVAPPEGEDGAEAAASGTGDAERPAQRRADANGARSARRGNGDGESPKATAAAGPIEAGAEDAANGVASEAPAAADADDEGMEVVAVADADDDERTEVVAVAHADDGDETTEALAVADADADDESTQVVAVAHDDDADADADAAGAEPEEE